MEEKEKLAEFLRDISCLDQLAPWTSKVNIFDILKVSRTEIRHSNILSWLLDPSENHGIGEAFLFGLLGKVLTKSDDVIRCLSAKLDNIYVLREWEHIDILVVCESSQFVVAIENKIGSKEHNSNNTDESQLATYSKKLEDRFRGYRIFQIYLTPEGDTASIEGWDTLTYSDVMEVLERIYNTTRHSLSHEVDLIINNYISTIKKDVIMDQDLIRICNEIYKKHKEALDLIYENRQDSIFEASQICQECIKELSSEKEIQIINATTSNIKFTTKGLRNGLSIDDKYRYYYFYISSKDNGIQIECRLLFFQELSSPHDEDTKIAMQDVVSSISSKTADQRPRKKEWTWWTIPVEGKKDFDSINKEDIKKYVGRCIGKVL